MTSKIVEFLFIFLIAAARLTGETPYPDSTSVFVSYSNADKNSCLDDSPLVYISFDGSDDYVPFVMDTGSVGIIASEDLFQPAPGAGRIGEGEQIYSSSGIIEKGVWWTATQNIYDKNGTLLATSNVPVLRVNKKIVNGCETGIAMMGIGFARESKSQPCGTPDHNPFLNLQTVLQQGELKPLPNDWVNGYVITPTGVHLGLNSTNTANAGWVKLMSWPEHSTSSLLEWKPAPMTIGVNNKNGSGHILMDTGVSAGFLTPPSGAKLHTLTTDKKCAADGNVIKVYLPEETNPVAFYTFTIGDLENLMKPSGVHVVNGPNPFFNTSRHVLKGMNFIYDNTNGYIGYIWNGQSHSSIGFVNPADTDSITTLLASDSFGKNVTFKAKVTGSSPSFSVPTGIVTLYIDNKIVAEVSLDENGDASYTTSTLISLNDEIKAKYSGDSRFKRSSATLVHKH